MEFDFKELVKNRTLENRLNQMAEECSEVIQACMKLQRDDVDKDRWKENLLEEMADVTIMIEEILQKLSDTDRESYQEWIDYKLKRELRRLAEKENKDNE